VFDYPAKSAQRRIQEITDPQLVNLVRALKRRRGGGRELLAYRGRDGGWVDIRSTDVNAHLRELTRAELSAKDFRTWNATVLAAVQLAAHDGEGTSKTARKRIARQVVKEVAGLIGNTPAVCRRSYIDPRVFDCFDSGATIREELGRHAGKDLDDMPAAARDRIEAAVIDLIRD
jgi:DNA topoisomerase I